MKLYFTYVFVACAEDETMVLSPWIYTDTQQCGDLISSVPDLYNDLYLSECQRQMGLDQKPTSVNNADVTTCYGMNNGTSKYQATLCCPGRAN